MKLLTILKNKIFLGTVALLLTANYCHNQFVKNSVLIESNQAYENSLTDKFRSSHKGNIKIRDREQRMAALCDTLFKSESLSKLFSEMGKCDLYQKFLSDHNIILTFAGESGPEKNILHMEHHQGILYVKTNWSGEDIDKIRDFLCGLIKNTDGYIPTGKYDIDRFGNGKKRFYERDEPADNKRILAL